MRNLLLAATAFSGVAFVAGPAFATLCPPTPSFAPDGAGLFTSELSNGSGVTLEESRTIQFADVDHDGEADLCWAEGNQVRCATHYSNPICWESNGQRICQTVPDPCWGFGNERFTVTLPFSVTSHERYYSTLEFPDLDNDGDADMCVRGPDGVYCARSTPSGFTNATRWTTGYGDNTGWGSAQYYSTVAYPDVNGDGRADVCGRGYAGIYCALSVSTAFSGNGVWTQGNDFGNVDGWGNGPGYYATIQFADIDGDGDDDVCGRGPDGILCATADHIQREFDEATYWTSQYRDSFGWNSQQYWSTIRFADVNGDSMADVCGRGGGGIYCGISYGSPDDEFVQANVLDISAFSNANGWDAEHHYASLSLTDVDGDGNADLCGRGVDGIYCARARTFWEGLQSNWTDLFNPVELWVSNFGNNYGWQNDESHWGTVQPANVISDWAGAEFCGRGLGGILCSYK